MVADEQLPSALIVEDHELAALGLRMALERDGRLRVIGVAGTVAAAVRAAKEEQPDLVLLDVRLPDGSGLDAVRPIKESAPGAAIVVLTLFEDDDVVLDALEAGASAFVPKTAPVHDIVATAAHVVENPGSFTAPGLGSALQRRAARQKVNLTDREAEILRHLADGLTAKEIATKTYIAESTVKAHVSRLYEKLGASNRAQALMHAMELGLLPH